MWFVGYTPQISAVAAVAAVADLEAPQETLSGREFNGEVAPTGVRRQPARVDVARGDETTRSRTSGRRTSPSPTTTMMMTTTAARTRTKTDRTVLRPGSRATAYDRSGGKA